MEYQCFPLIIIGIPGLIGIFYLFWVIPPSPQFGTLNNRTTILYTVLLLMYRFFFACIWASYQGMIPDIAQNEKQQIQINANINIFSYIGQIIGTFLPVIILTSFPFIESAESDYFWLLNSNGIGFQIRQNIQSFLFVLFIILVISFVLALSFNSIAKLDSSCLNTKIKIKHSFRSTYILFLKDKKLVYTYLTNLVFVIIIGSLNFISINFAVYSLKLGPLLNLYYVLIVIASFSSFFLSSLLAQKWGIKKMLLGGSVVISCCLLSMSVFFIFNSLFFIQIGACILISMISFMAGTTGIYFSSIIIKLSSQTEKTLNRTISGNSLSIFHAFGNLGNIFAVLMVSAVLDWLGSTLFTTYVWIFVGCGVLNLATIFFVRKIHIS